MDQGIDEPLAQLRFGTAAYYQRDVLNSVTSLSNSASALVNTYNYDSFGKLTVSGSTLTNSIQYTGREADSETGLLFDRARYLDPYLGRFVSEEPMGFDGGINFYGYVSNDPVDNVDPFGWKTCTTRIMLVTAYCSRGPGSDWPHYKLRHKRGKARSVGPGDVAVANSDSQPYPFGSSVTVVDNATGTTDYTGTVHDTGAGWDSNHHDVLPDQWIDIWLPCRKARDYGKRYRTVTICHDDCGN
jgi:RHS repeat-associated protein